MKKKELEEIINRYFELIRRLRAGDPTAVDKLMELWDANGTFEFAGAKPVVGTFKGAVAIHTLYSNRLQACKMGLKIQTRSGKEQEVTLGMVDTDVQRIRLNGTNASVGWRTTIGTEQGHGFDISGAHVFTFTGSKIKQLRITMSEVPARSHIAALNVEKLNVRDVGRLSLAAWPVV